MVDDPEERNAFVLPGGKVFVFSGLLDICNGEDGLAAVLGHEIAHNLANHMGERESSMIIAVAGVWLLSLLLSLDPGWMNWIFQFGYTMPGSRRQEVRSAHINGSPRYSVLMILSSQRQIILACVSLYVPH